MARFGEFGAALRDGCAGLKNIDLGAAADFFASFGVFEDAFGDIDRLAGDVLTANHESAGSLEWGVYCVDGSKIAAWRTTDTNVEWRRFAVDFDVPAEGCPAQWLRLRGIRADRRSTVEVWYDKLAINP